MDLPARTLAATARHETATGLARVAAPGERQDTGSAGQPRHLDQGEP
jgi:hypothetical protein